MAKVCLPCGRGFHDECPNFSDDGTKIDCCCGNDVVDGVSQASSAEEVGPMGRRDVGESAGRKEAARLYPIDHEAECEWRGLSNCGGGHYPIVGCIAGMQQNRHHGPVKNTTENSRHNIHLICAKCHNTWHAKNDVVYNEKMYAQLPHKPKVATPEELVRGNVGIKPGAPAESPVTSD